MTAVTIVHEAPAHSADWPTPEPLRLIAVDTIGGKVCPDHHTLLKGGPRWLHCDAEDGPRGGHRVFAAQLEVDRFGRAS